MPRHRLIALAIALLTIAILGRVAWNDFVSYDDPDYLTANPIIQKGLSGEGLAWAFGEVHGEQTYWHPLTWLSHMIDVQLFGMKPAGHHLVSLALHTANAVLLFLVLHTMTGALWRSAIVAAFFAIHPLQVESVAWATERKNVLSTLFWMLTLWFYALYTKAPSRTRYLLSLAAFALGLMCKPALVPLPGVLLLLDYWPLKRLQLQRNPKALANAKRLLVEKIPFAALAIGSAILTLSAHKSLGMLEQAASPPRSLQLGNIALSYVRYIGKTIWPVDLAVFYPFPQSIPTETIVVCLLALIATTGIALWRLKSRPWLAVGWFWFVGVLVPTIGIVQVGIQAMADRFVYVPVIGLFIALVWGLSEKIERFNLSKRSKAFVAVLPLAALSGLSFVQVGYWKDDYAMFEHARTATRNNYMAYTAVGGILLRQGKTEEAMNYFRIAQGIQPAYADVYYSIGVAMYQRRNLPEAIANFQEALRLKPFYPEARINLALAQQAAGDLGPSIENYRIALRNRPDSEEAHLGIGNALLVAGQAGEALDHFRATIRLNPKSSGAMARLAWILATHSNAAIRNGQEAVRLAEEACRLTKNKHVQTINTLAAAYAETGNFTQAVQTAEHALALAKSEGDSALIPIIENLRDRYARHEAYRE